MQRFYEQLWDAFTKKALSLVELSIKLVFMPKNTLYSRLDNDDTDFKPSLELFIFLSFVSFIIIQLAIPVDFNVSEVALGFVLGQVIMALFYSGIAYLSLKVTRSKPIMLVVIQSTLYLYGKTTLCVALACAIIVQTSNLLDFDVLFTILVVLFVSFSFLLHSWWIMAKRFDKSSIKACISFIFAIFLSLPVTLMLKVINDALIQIKV